MILLLLAVILPVAILFFSNRQKRLQRARYPPGPPALPIIGNLHQFGTSTLHIYLWRLSKKYGPVMSMNLGSKPVLVVSSPRIAKEVLKTQDLVFCSRPKLLGHYKLSYNGSDIVYMPYSDSWRELRKICVLHLLSSKQVQSFQPIREDEVFRMIKNLSVRANSGEVANLSLIVVALTSTLICRTAFGKMSDEGSGQLRFHKLLTRLDKIYKDLDEFYQELIDEHLDPNRPKSLNPDLLIQLKEENSCSIHLTWNHIKAILMDIFSAGTDTSAATIIAAMTALIENPTIMRKLQSEIREVIGEKGKVTEDDLPKLSYLKAVIKETLRMYPPAPLLLPRETLEKCNIEEYIIPAKTLVYINAWAIARDHEYWEHPNEFEPERFFNTKVTSSDKIFM
ncbi:cytochrome [Sesamum angolense]|uniref:Cytochrome n=1 Tax=Sesamum angolense TaxID=2727404 RepID=A0AAE1WSM4_9LAMI|nr:cytochrome [Sesamum angolense]